MNMIYIFKAMSNIMCKFSDRALPVIFFLSEIPLRLFYFIIFFSDRPFREEKIKIGKNDMIAYAGKFLFIIGMLSILFSPLFLKK